MHFYMAIILPADVYGSGPIYMPRAVIAYTAISSLSKHRTPYDSEGSLSALCCQNDI